jgi:hypothetical protein
MDSDQSIDKIAVEIVRADRKDWALNLLRRGLKPSECSNTTTNYSAWPWGSE